MDDNELIYEVLKFVNKMKKDGKCDNIVALANFTNEADFKTAKPNQDWKTEQAFNLKLNEVLISQGIKTKFTEFDIESYSSFCRKNNFEIQSNPSAVAAWAAIQK